MSRQMSNVVKVKYENSLRRLTLRNPQLITYDYLEGRIRELLQLPITAKLAVTYTDEEDDVVIMANDQDVIDALIMQALNPLRLQVALLNPTTSPASPTPTINGAVGKELEINEVDVALQRLSLTELMTKMISAPVPTSLTDNVGSAYVVPTSAGAPLEPKPIALSQVNMPSTTDALPNQGLTFSAPVVHGGITCDVCGAFPITGTRWKSLKRHNYDLCSECFGKAGDMYDYFRIDSPQFSRCPELHRMMMHMPPSPIAHPIPQFDWSREYDRFAPVADSIPPFEWSREYERLPSDPFGTFYSGAPVSFGGGPLDKLMDARFICDFTLFDGAEISPGVSFSKTCRVRNNGIYPWPVITYLEHVGGSLFGQESRILLPIPIDGLAPEQEMQVSIDLIAPTKPGLHVSFWSLALESGHRFGNRLSVVIQVRKETAENAELAASTPVASSQSLGALECSSVLRSIHTLRLENDEPQAAEIGGGSVSPSGADSDSEITSGDETGQQKKALRKFDLFDLGEEFAIVYAKDAAIEVPKEGEREVCWQTPVNAPQEQREDFWQNPDNVPQDGEREGLSKTSVKVSQEEVHLKTSLASDVMENDEGSIAYPVIDVPSDAGPVTCPAMNNPIEGIQPLLLDSILPASNASGFANSRPDPEPLTYPAIFEISEPTPNVSDSMYFDSVMAVPSTPVEEVAPASRALLARLEAMGFANSELNLELLEKNNMDLRSTLDDLCTADEWEPFLTELEEMGFLDVSLNRRLMFKNDGSVKRVVKDLVQMYRDAQTKTFKMEM